MGLRAILRNILSNAKSKPVRATTEAVRPEFELSERDISDGCLLITQEVGDVVRVAIRGGLVDRVASSTAAPKWELPILLACRTLELPGEKIEKILANRGSHNIKTGNASKFHSTYHWGNEEVYFVQILSTYL
jgi:hypothetical protein